jgi:hypothetical protein
LAEESAEESAFGYDEMSKQTFYGLRAHLHVAWPGVIVGVELASADAHDLHLAEEMLEEAGTKGWVLGDRNYWSPRGALGSPSGSTNGG